MHNTAEVRLFNQCVYRWHSYVAVSVLACVILMHVLYVCECCQGETHWISQRATASSSSCLANGSYPWGSPVLETPTASQFLTKEHKHNTHFLIREKGKPKIGRNHWEGQRENREMRWQQRWWWWWAIPRRVKTCKRKEDLIFYCPFSLLACRLITKLFTVKTHQNAFTLKLSWKITQYFILY